MTLRFNNQVSYIDFFNDDNFDNIILTTFQYDRGFIEDELLPCLVGFGNIKDIQDRFELEDAIASMDISIISSALFTEPKTLYGYHLIPYKGIQHSKIAVLSSPNLVRFIVGSVNLTKEAFYKNLEAFIVLDFKTGCEHPLSLAHDILNYLRIIANYNGKVENQIDKIKDRLLKMGLENAYKSGEVNVSFIAHHGNADKSVYRQLIDTIGKENIYQVKVVTPFFEDLDGRFLQSFIDYLRGKNARYLDIYFPSLSETVDDKEIMWQINANSRLFETIKQNIDLIRLYPVSYLHAEGHLRQLHAKVMFIKTDKANYLMVGSSNLTKRGYGFEGTMPNAEANLLIKVPNPNEKTLKSFIPSEIKPQKIKFISQREPFETTPESVFIPPLIIQNAEYDKGMLRVILYEEYLNAKVRWQIWLGERLLASSDKKPKGYICNFQIPTTEMAENNVFLKVNVDGYQYYYPIVFYDPAELIFKKHHQSIDINTLYLYWAEKLIRPKTLTLKESQIAQLDKTYDSTKPPQTPDLLLFKIKRFIKSLTAIRKFLDGRKIKDSDTMLKNRIYGIFGSQRMFDIIEDISDVSTNFFCYNEAINAFEEIKQSYSEYPKCYDVINQYIQELRAKRDSFKPPKEWMKYLRLIEQINPSVRYMR